MLLKEVEESTSQIFENEVGCKELVVPEPPLIWKDKLEAFESNNLESQKTSLIFDLRCWQAKEMGFSQIESSEMVKMLMGEPHTDQVTGKERQTCEWMYNHHTDELASDCSWGGNPEIFKMVDRKGFWYMPPFSKYTVWQCQFGKLNYLKRTIPYGVVLRIAECKKTKLFNCFHVLAPLEAWERKTDIDPIVVATIWEIVESEDGKRNLAGQVAHFFLAQW